MGRRARVFALLLLAAAYFPLAGALAGLGAPRPLLALAGSLIVVLYLREVFEAEAGSSAPRG